MKHKLQKIKKESQELCAEISSDLRTSKEHTKQIGSEYHRVTELSHAPMVVINEIDRQFEQATKLHGKDIVFLFGAAAIQTLRWVLQPSTDWNFSLLSSSERMTSQQGGQIEKTGIWEYLQKEGFNEAQIKDVMQGGHINHYTWQKLLVAPVPYDAMHGSGRIAIAGVKDVGKELYGKNHHVATWGHDPFMGHIIGPLNITARMITFRDFQTFHVRQVGDSFEQVITYRSSMGDMAGKAIKSWSEDSKRLFVSVAKQEMHFQSDKYTKLGLPIPLLSANTAQSLLEKGWNSNEMNRLFQHLGKNLGAVGIQFGFALIIDSIIRALHLLCYDKSIDGTINAYTARSNKVVLYSNLLAGVANGLFVATTGQVGKIDIGGYLNLVKNIVVNVETQRKMKQDFLKNELYDRIVGTEYDFMKGDI